MDWLNKIITEANKEKTMTEAERTRITGTLRVQGKAYYLLSPPPSWEEVEGLLEFLVVPSDPCTMTLKEKKSVPVYPYPRQLVVRGGFSVELTKVRKILVILKKLLI